MKKFLGIGIGLAFIFFIVALLAAHSITAYRPDKKQKIKFKTNYKIDLKQDCYLVKDSNGDIHSVPFGELEDWLEKDNL